MSQVKFEVVKIEHFKRGEFVAILKVEGGGYWVTPLYAGLPQCEGTHTKDLEVAQVHYDVLKRVKEVEETDDRELAVVHERKRKEDEDEDEGDDEDEVAAAV